MNKQKLMELVSKAFDEGAHISVLNYGHCTNKEAAEKNAKEFSEAVGIPVEEVKSLSGENTWYRVEDQQTSVTFHYDNQEGFLVEDVDLEGMEDEEYATN